MPMYTDALLRASCLLALLALTACQPRDTADAQTTSSATPAPAPPMTQGAHAINGTATYLERIQVPPGASLRVQLIDNLLADTPKAILADITLKDVAGPPYAFSLPYDPVKLRPNGMYGLHAALTGPDGRLWFVSDTRVPVEPARNLPVEIRMVRVSAADMPTTAGTGNASHWQCGEARVGATFEQASERVLLSVNGRRLTLPLARSASGARYADADGNEFWTKGDTGTLSLAGEDKQECTRAQGPSPWDAARDRGIAFRAVGNEPGWLVEVSQGEAPSLHAELDFGARKLEIARVQPRSNGTGFIGKTDSGTQVELAIERKPCQDDMSGARFEATAQLTAGGKTYRGCGAFLTE